MSRRYLSVEDYSEGINRSREVNTDMSFEDNYRNVQSVKQSEVVVAAYVNENYKQLQNYNQAVEEIREEVEGFSETKQDTLTAGDNITIDSDNVISSVNTTYTAGTNVSISDENVISAINTTYTAGTGIDITNDVISNTQTSAEWGSITGTLADQTDLNNALTGLSNDISDKQDELVSGTNIKTINNNSILGNGDLQINTTPIGSTIEYCGDVAPTGWLICDGSAISRTTYADLYAVIGTKFGTGDGSTTFNLPDFRGKQTIMVDSNDNSMDTIGMSVGNKKISHLYGLTGAGYYRNFGFVEDTDAGLLNYNSNNQTSLAVINTNAVNKQGAVNNGVVTSLKYVSMNYYTATAHTSYESPLYSSVVINKIIYAGV